MKRSEKRSGRLRGCTLLSALTTLCAHTCARAHRARAAAARPAAITKLQRSANQRASSGGRLSQKKKKQWICFLFSRESNVPLSNPCTALSVKNAFRSPAVQLPRKKKKNSAECQNRRSSKKK